jgi:hypothetical protein
VASWNRRTWPVDQIRTWVEVEHKTHDDVGCLLNCSRGHVSSICRRFGIQTQRRGPRSGPGHPDWRGGRILDKDGYVLLWVQSHPNRRKHTHYMLEHRLVMEQMLGRYLTEREVVHHKNGNHSDNRPENLELFQSNGDHLRVTTSGKPHDVSPEGRARLSAAVRKMHKTRAQSKASAGQSTQTTGHSTGTPGSTPPAA